MGMASGRALLVRLGLAILHDLVLNPLAVGRVPQREQEGLDALHQLGVLRGLSYCHRRLDHVVAERILLTVTIDVSTASCWPFTGVH
jgi:hypothetical protein